MKTKDLVYFGIYTAMFTVVDYMTNTISFLRMPNGGTIGLSTLVLLLSSYQLGWKKGVFLSCLSVSVQFITGPMYIPNIVGLLFDYVLAYGIYGLASRFPNYGYIYTGVLITSLIRYLFHCIGGVIVWETDIMASLLYNATYMLPTTVLGVIIVPIVHKRFANIS